VTQQIPGTTIARVTNASGARVRGIEFEPSWQVADSFLLYGNGAFTWAKYTESFICQISGVFQECRTKKLRGVVPFKGTAGFVFTPDLGTEGGFRIGASVDYSDKFYNDAPNTELTAAKARTLVDALIAYDSPANWTLSLEGKNIFNKKYWSTGLNLGATIVVYPNDPRMIVGRFRYKF
jgi:outer membrane receptor protein involved in Fe transport